VAELLMVKVGDRVLTPDRFIGTVIAVAPKRSRNGYLPVIVKYDPGQDGATLLNIGNYPDTVLTAIPDEEVDDYA
jgi:hypothetical protein